MLPPPIADSVNLLFFYTSTSFTRNYACIHTRLFHMISRTFRCCAGGGAGNVSVHFLTSLMLLSTRLLTWSHLSSGGVGGGVITSLCNLLTSSTLHTFLDLVLTYVLLEFARELWSQDHSWHALWTNVGITVKMSFQTVSIQRMRRTNFWMLRSGTMSTNGNGDTIIAIPRGKWFPKFSKHFANETLHLKVTQIKRAESATGGGTLFMWILQHFGVVTKAPVFWLFCIPHQMMIHFLPILPCCYPHLSTYISAS